MENKIIYGKQGTGKTIALYELARTFEGTVFFIDPKDDFEEIKKQFNDVIKNDIYYLKEDKDFLNALQESKYFYHFDTHALCNKQAKDPIDLSVFSMLIDYSKRLLSKSNKSVLIAINHFDELNLTHANNGKSLLLNLLELNKENPNVTIVLVVQDLNMFKNKYRNESGRIFSLVDLMCSNEGENFSGELRVRFAKELHKQLYENAVIQNVSLNSYITYLLTKGVTEDKFRTNNIDRK